MKNLLWLSLVMLTACRFASSGVQVPVLAGNLTREYKESSATVRNRYDGTEITVKGYTLSAASLPKPGDDQGSLSFEDQNNDPGQRVICWFSREQATEFSKIKGSQFVTVRGVFNGEAGAELKFCKLVNVELRNMP